MLWDRGEEQVFQTYGAQSWQREATCPMMCWIPLESDPVFSAIAFPSTWDAAMPCTPRSAALLQFPPLCLLCWSHSAEQCPTAISKTISMSRSSVHLAPALLPYLA